MPQNLTMKTKMALAVSLLFIAFATGLAVATLKFFEREFARAISSEQFSLTSALAGSIDQKINLAKMALVGAATRVTPATVHSPQSACSYLENRPTLLALFDDGVFFLRPDGSVIAETPYHERYNLVDRDFLQQLCRTTVSRRTPYVSNYYRSLHGHGNPALFLAVPLFTPRGEIFGIMGGSIDLSGKNFLEDLSHTRVGRTGYVFVCDSDRTILAHPETERIMNGRTQPGTNRLFDRAVEGFDGSGETVNSRGLGMLTSYKHLAANGWIVAATLPLSEAYGPLYTARHYFIAATIGGTFLILLLVWALMDRLISPLAAMTRHVRDLPDKKGAARLFPLPAQDEIGTLAQAFNGMVAKLEEQQAALRESENNFRALAETASDGMVVIAGGENIVYANYRIGEITGYPVAELLSRHLQDLVSTEDLPPLRHTLAQIVSQQNVPRDQESLFIRADSSEVPVEITNAMTFWRGEPAGLMIVRDIAERKRVERELRESYRLLQNTFASLNESVFVVDTQTRTILDCNIMVEKMFGYRREEIVGATTSFLHVTPEMSEWFGSEMLKAYMKLGYFETVFTMKRNDGTVFDSEHFVTPIRDDSGEIVSHVCVVRDISERKRTEEALKVAAVKAENERARAESILAAIGEAITIIGRDLRILYQNEMQKEMLGEHEGEQCFAAYECRTKACSVCPVARVFMDGRIHLLEKKICIHDRTADLELVASPLRDASGETIAAIMVVRDISERKRTEERVMRLNSALQVRAAELSAMNGELEAFSYSVSHDLKAPLTSIYAAAQALAEESGRRLDKHERFFVANICKGSERMVDLLDAMLLLSQVMCAELVSERVSLTVVARGILLRMQLENPERQVDWTVLPGMEVTGDSRLLTSALENLLGNAWKYSARVPSARIDFGCVEEKNGRRFFVRDNGAGFNPARAAELFIPFRRLHRPDQFPGTGIGLATVQRIITRHGGRVWAEGEEGAGATFYFTVGEAPSADP